MLSAFLLVGCQSGQPEVAFSPIPGESISGSPTTSASTGSTIAAHPSTAQQTRTNAVGGPDTLRVGAVLTFIFSDLPNPPLPFDVTIREDGTITLPLNLTFTAAGKTVGDLANEVRARYVPKYYVNMTVTIRVQNGFYSVGGEVKSPNRIPYMGPTTVVRAIQSAGDCTEYANKSKVQLTHSDGRVEIVNYKKALKDPKFDREVLPGDSIVVRRSIW